MNFYITAQSKIKTASLLTLLVAIGPMNCAGDEHQSNRVSRSGSDSKGVDELTKYQFEIDFTEGQKETASLALADSGLNLAGVALTITGVTGAVLCAQNIVGATGVIELPLVAGQAIPTVNFQTLDGVAQLKDCRFDMRGFTLDGLTFARTRTAEADVAANYAAIAAARALSYVSGATTLPVTVTLQPAAGPIAATQAVVFETPVKVTTGAGSNTVIANRQNSTTVTLNGGIRNPYSITQAATVLAFNAAGSLFLSAFNVTIAGAGVATTPYAICVKRSDGEALPNSVATVQTYLTNLTATNGACFTAQIAVNGGVTRISMGAVGTAGSLGQPFTTGITAATKFTFMIYKISGAFVANAAPRKQVLDVNGDVLVAAQSFTLQ